MKIIILFLFSLLLIFPSSSWAEVDTLSSNADAWIFKACGNHNYGDDIGMLIQRKSVGYYRDGIIRFNLSSIPGNAVIDSALLRIYYIGRGDAKCEGFNTNGKQEPDTFTAGVHRVLGSWDESTVTWNNQPSHNSTATSSSCDTVSPGDAVEWVVTSDVKLFIEADEPNYGWKIIPTKPGKFPRFGCKEHDNSSYHPMLEVTYHLPDDSLIITPQSIAPLSVDVGESEVGMVKLTIVAHPNAAIWTNIKLDRIGNGKDSDISCIKIYKDDNDGNFDGGDILISSGSDVFNNGVANIDITDQSITTSSQIFFIVFDISSSAQPGVTIGLRCPNKTYFEVEYPDGVSRYNFPFESSTKIKGHTLSPKGDAWIYQACGNNNYGDDIGMLIQRKSVGYYRDGIIWFDLSSLSTSTVIDSAVLRLYYIGRGDAKCEGFNTNGKQESDTFTAGVHRVLGSWDESTVTWNNQPSHNSTATSSFSGTVGPGDAVEWTVTSDVKFFVDNPSSNYGWKIIPTTPGNFPRFGCKEHSNSDYHPILLIWTGSSVYYVRTDGSNSNSGTGPSASEAWQTITHALTQISGGVTVYVAPGNYTENAIGTNIIGSSSSKTYLIADTDGSEFPDISSGSVIIEPTTSSSPTIDLNNCDYFVIDGFTIRYCTGGENAGHIMLRNGSDNVEVKNCIIYSSGASASAARGIRVENSDSVNIHDNYIHHLYGAVSIVNGSDYATIARNRCHDTYDETISINSDFIIVENNVGYNSQGGISLWGDADNCVVKNNTAFNNSDHGIRIYTGCDNNTVFNNLCYNNTNFNIGDAGTGNQFDYNFCSGTGGTDNAGTNGITSGDPQLLSTGHIRASSVCRNVGTSSFNGYSAPSEDIDGQSRPLDGNYDIGCDERDGGNTYYVRTDGDDNNDGLAYSKDRAWAHIDTAAHRMAAGCTVYVAPGTYPEDVEPQQSGSGESERTYYIGDNDASEFPDVSADDVIVNGENTRNYGFSADYGGYITIDGFTIKNTLQDAITFGWTESGVTIINNTIDNCGSGVKIEGRDNTNNKKFIVSNNTITNLTYGYGVGISIWGRDNYIVDTVICENNTIGSLSGSWTNGIKVGSPIQYLSLVNNTVYEVSGSNSDYGSGIFCDSVLGGSVDRNTVYSNNRYGIRLTRSHNLTISNNICYKNSQAGIGLLNASKNNTIVNNTFYNNTTRGIYLDEGSTTDTVFNNIVCADGSGNYCIYVSDNSQSGFASDYNDLYYTNGAICGYWGADRSDLSAWRTASSQDNNSISDYPSFIDTAGTNFHIEKTSPCTDAGTGTFNSKSAPTYDIDNETRPMGGGYDIGADEAVKWVTSSDDSIIVTSPGEFEIIFHGNYGGTIRYWYDLENDANKSTNLAPDLIDFKGLFNLHYESPNNTYWELACDTVSSGSGHEFKVIEESDTRVRVLIKGHMKQRDSPYTEDANSVINTIYTIYRTGQVYVNLTRERLSSDLSVYDMRLGLNVDAGNTGEWNHATETNDPFADENDYDMDATNKEDDFVIQYGTSPTNEHKASVLFAMHKDWTTSNGHLTQATHITSYVTNTERCIGWEDKTNPITWTQGTNETWHFLLRLKPDVDVMNSAATAKPYSDDYRNPDSPTMLDGTFLTGSSACNGDANQDGFNEEEGCYEFQAKKNHLLFQHVNAGTYTKYNPIYKIHEIYPITNKQNRTLFHSRLDSESDITSPQYGTGGRNDGATFVLAKRGYGVRFDAVGEKILIPTNENFNKAKGTIEFWYKPNYDHDDGVMHQICGYYNSATNDTFQILKWVDNSLGFNVEEPDGGDCSVKIPPDKYSWKAGEWVHIRVTWDDTKPIPKQLKLYLNGEDLTPYNDFSPADYNSANYTPPDSFVIGNVNGSYNTDGVIDEFYIYDDVIGGTPDQPTIGNPTNIELPTVHINGVLQTEGVDYRLSQSLLAATYVIQLLRDINSNDVIEINRYDPYAVELLSFTAIPGWEEIVLIWETEVEVSNKKWLIKRREEQKGKEKIIGEIPSYGKPHTYMYRDSLVKAGIPYWYRLGSVRLLGDTVWHKEVSCVAKAYKIFKFALYQSYPNPFKGKTYIKYIVPGKFPTKEKVYTSLKVYDITGRLVRTLVDEKLIPGEYITEWDGTTNRGHKVSSGVYFYRLQVGKKVSPRKLIFFY